MHAKEHAHTETGVHPEKKNVFLRIATKPGCLLFEVASGSFSAICQTNTFHGGVYQGPVGNESEYSKT